MEIEDRPGLRSAGFGYPQATGQCQSLQRGQFLRYTTMFTTYGLIMSRTHYKTWTTELKPAFDTTGKPISQLYELSLFIRKDGQPYRIRQVHVPHALSPLLAQGAVRDVVIDTLEIGSLASRLLPYSPMYIVLAVASTAGELHCITPPALIRLRWGTLTLGCVALFGGAAVLMSTLPAWIGTVACIIGSHCLRTALRVPTSTHLNIR